ncbi:MAG: hypothetical protein J0H12_03950 [Candidatus Paracaedimonas acanthamoebae]|jgi:thiaminase|uniref:Thiaminase-2/PQQC domain-containing protein n=1 Tax=Candidatus Paracaedimonas acanthamoebae TaxID=244581 RepID=A0A8J7Q0F0_9PROT|nr:hypothetical protein [Candidatus Paracaedimonas acanthamoebae]
MNQVNLIPPIVDSVESVAHLLQEAALKHPFYGHLIDGSLTAEQYDLFVRQQTWIWHELSRNLLSLSRSFPTTCITSALLRVANISLILADNFNDQVNDFKIETYKASPVCKEYIGFFRSLIDGEQILLLLVAIIPRFGMMAMSCQRYITLKPLEHPYNKFIENCISLNAEEYLTRIINILDAQCQSISQKDNPAIRQVFLEAALHEYKLLNEAYYLTTM